jgi:DNA-binding transcriptional LysR family regulator
MLKLLPPLLNMQLHRAPNTSLEILQVDLNELEWWLATGKVDFAMGSFPSLSKGIRRQTLWTERYASVVRRSHPRLHGDPTLEQFKAEKHVVVSALGVGHAHQHAQRIIEATVPARNIACRVPSFITAALLATHSDVIVTLPKSTAVALASDLELTVLAPPVDLPTMDICQYWHQLVHRELANQWIRAQFAELFRDKPARGAARLR